MRRASLCPQRFCETVRWRGQMRTTEGSALVRSVLSPLKETVEGVSQVASSNKCPNFNT